MQSGLLLFVTTFLVVGTPLLVLYLRESVKNIVRETSEKALADYRHVYDKELADRNARHQKSLRDYGQYSAKRHDIYAKLYRQVRIANDRFSSLLGFTSEPDFANYVAEDIEAYRKQYKLKGRDVSRAHELLLSNDRDKLGSFLHDLHRKVLLHYAERAFVHAKNTEALYALYLSDSVQAAMFDVRQSIAAVSVSFMHDADDPDRKQMAKKHEMNNRVLNLYNVMRSEMQQPDDHKPDRTDIARDAT